MGSDMNPFIGKSHCWIESTVKQKGIKKNEDGLYTIGYYPSLNEGMESLRRFKLKHPKATSLLYMTNDLAKKLVCVGDVVHCLRLSQKA